MGVLVLKFLFHILSDWLTIQRVVNHFFQYNLLALAHTHVYTMHMYIQLHQAVHFVVDLILRDLVI